MAKLDRLGWAAHHTYQFGPTYLGVRSSDASYSKALAQALPANLRRGLSAPANFSIILPRRDGSAVNLAALHHSHRQVLRTSDVARLTRAVFSHLGSYSTVPEFLALRMSTAIRGDAAALVPLGVATLPQSLVASLQREQIHLHDAPWVQVDLDRGEVVIPALSLDLHEAALAPFSLGGDVHHVTGRFALVGTIEEASEAAEPSLLFRLARYLQSSINLEAMGVEKMVDRLLRLIEEAPARRVVGRGRELANAIALSLR